MPMAKGDTGDESAEDAQATELYRKFQGILNKLTPQKFQSLAEQALKLEINTEERLSRCIDKIFTKVSFFCLHRIIGLTVIFCSIGFGGAKFQHRLCQPV